MIDHFGYDAVLGGKDHATVLATAVVQSAAVLPAALPGPVLFRGIGLSVSPESETVSEGRWDGCCQVAGWQLGSALGGGRCEGLVLVQLGAWFRAGPAKCACFAPPPACRPSTASPARPPATAASSAPR